MPKTTQQYIDITPSEFRKLNKEELKQAVKTLANTANKRLRELEEKNIPFEYVFKVKNRKYLKPEGKNKRLIFSYKNLDFKQLKSAFNEIRNFLELPTTEVKKYKKYRKSIEKILPKGFFDNRERENNFWRAFNHFKEKYSSEIYNYNEVLNWARLQDYEDYSIEGIEEKIFKFAEKDVS